MKSEFTGALLVAVCAFFWGISGISVQILFTRTDVSTGQIIAIRLLSSGILLLLYCAAKYRTGIFDVWKSPRDAADILLFSLIGAFAVQYTFFAAIKASDSATASVLQYTYPVLVMLWGSFSAKKAPDKIQVFSVLLAVSGTFLITTGGKFSSLAISEEAAVWGLTSSVCIAFYTIHSKRIIGKFGTWRCQCWGLLLGGIFTLALVPSSRELPDLDGVSVLLTAVIVILGTLIPFGMYLAGVQKIGGIKAGALASIETFTVTVISVAFFNKKITLSIMLGMLCIIATVILPAIVNRRSKQSSTNQIVHKL